MNGRLPEGWWASAFIVILIMLLTAAAALAQGPANVKRIIKVDVNANGDALPQPTPKDFIDPVTQAGSCVPLGHGYYDCEERAVIPNGAQLLAAGPKRYRQLAKRDADFVMPSGIQPHHWMGEAPE